LLGGRQESGRDRIERQKPRKTAGIQRASSSPAESPAASASAARRPSPFRPAFREALNTPAGIIEAPRVAAEVQRPALQFASVPPAFRERPQSIPPPAPRQAGNPSFEPVRAIQTAEPRRPRDVTLPSLAGTWVVSRSPRNASPHPAASARLILSDTGDWITGILTGTYEVPKKIRLDPKVALTFAGRGGSASLKFPFSAADGSRGTLEMIRLPGNPNTIEVVWEPNGRNLVFDDLFVRLR
jgi:hypothetical protein